MPKTARQRVRTYCSQCYIPVCDFRGLCRFPHGCCYSTMAILSGMGGLMMNLYVIGTCLFMRVTQVNPVNGDPVPGSERGYGFLSREADYGIMPDYKQCVYYPQAEYDVIFDGWMHAGRAFAFISAILATVCFMVLLLTCCCAFSPSMFERWLFWMYISAAITIALAMFAYGCEWCADAECKVADGTGWAISAFMFHLVSANTVKSFAAAGAPTRNAEPGDDADDDLDDLYYEREEDKYPPPNPNGPRGFIVRKNGKREFDNGEDYYDEMGRMYNPNGEDEGAHRARRFDSVASDDLHSTDFDDISDHDLEKYASDSDDEDDDDDDKNRKFDEYGNRIYDPKAAQHGNLGVGYEEEHQQFDEFGNPLFVDPRVQQFDEYGKNSNDPARRQQQQFDEYGNPMPQQFDEYGNPVPYGSPGAYEHQHGHDGAHQYDKYGNPIRYDEYDKSLLTSVSEEQHAGGDEHEDGHHHHHHHHQADQIDEYGNRIPQQAYDEYGNAIPRQQQAYDEYGNPLAPQHRQQAYDEYGNPIMNKGRDDDDGRVFA